MLDLTSMYLNCMEEKVEYAFTEQIMDLIERWANNEEYMFPEYKKYQAELQMKEGSLLTCGE